MRAKRAAPGGARRDQAAGREAPAATLRCEHFPPCRGCPHIPVPYADQLVAKREELRAALGPVLDGAGDVVRATVPSPRLRGYRNHSRLVFRRMARGGHTHVGLGLYLPGTHRVVHIPNCPIQPERLNAVARSATRLAERLGLTVYDERHGSGALRYLALRCDRAQQHVLATIIVAEDVGESLRVLARALHDAHPEIAGALLHVNARRSNVLFAGADAWTMGAERLEDRLGRFRVFVSPRSFLQVNHAQAEWIYARLEAELGAASPAPAGGPEVVLDLYAGLGAIALHLARPGRLVVGVEESEEAVADARRAAHANGVDGVQFVAARVEDFLSDPAAHGVDLAGRVSAAVLNPPRSGVRPGVMEALAELAPARIAYVSCRPGSLARDLGLVVPRYAVEELTPVDMIPFTPHIEALVFLRRAQPGGP